MSKLKSWTIGFLASAAVAPTWLLSNNLGLAPATTTNDSTNVVITIRDPRTQAPPQNQELVAVAPAKPQESPKPEIVVAPPKRQQDDSLGLGADVTEDDVALPSDHDITAQDIEEFMPPPGINFQTFDKQNHVRIRFKTYAACAHRLSFPDERKAIYSKDDHAALFRIRDNGFISCMSKYKGKGENGGWPTCKQKFETAGKVVIKDICTEVTKNISLNGLNVAGDVESISVKLAWRDSNCSSFSDPNRVKGTKEVASGIVTAEMDAAKKRLAENHKLETSIRAMLAGTTKPNERAFTEASERLRTDSAVDEEVLSKWESDFAKILKEQVEAEARQQIVELTREGTSAAAVDGITEDLISIARAHPERTKDVAAALKTVANAQAQLRDEDSNNVIGNPDAVLNRLKDINEYDSEARKLSREYRFAKFDSYTPDSYRDLLALNKELRPLEKDAYKNLSRACNQNHRGDASLEACANAQDEMQRIQQIKMGAYQNLASNSQFGGGGAMGQMGHLGMNGGFGRGFGAGAGFGVGFGFNPQFNPIPNPMMMGGGFGYNPMMFNPNMYGGSYAYNPMMMGGSIGYPAGYGAIGIHGTGYPSTGFPGMGYGAAGFGGGGGAMFPSTFGPQGYGV